MTQYDKNIQRNIWVNGCFDIIHYGHIELLRYAYNLGGAVHVGIDSDSRIHKSKGKSRPINNEYFRKHLLDALKYVHYVHIFNSDYELSSIIKEIKPTYIVVGEEYRDKKVIGSEHCSNIRYFPRIEMHSTTEIIKKIKDNG